MRQKPLLTKGRGFVGCSSHLITVLKLTVAFHDLQSRQRRQTSTLTSDGVSVIRQQAKKARLQCQTLSSVSLTRGGDQRMQAR